MNKRKNRGRNRMEEIKTAGYVEGYFDGINCMLDELDRLKVLKMGWKDILNKKNKYNLFFK